MRSSTLLVGFGVVFGAGCALDDLALDIEPLHVVGRIDPALGVACHAGDTLQLIAKNGDTIVEEVTAPCTDGDVELDLSASASVKARLLAARGAAGLADDIVVGESDRESSTHSGTFLINVNRGFISLVAGLVRDGSSSSCRDAGVLSFRVEIAEGSGAPTVATFACDAVDKLSAPLASSRAYDVRAVALGANGVVVAEGVASVAIPRGNAYVDATIELVIP
jgi:hypothetical protein